MRLSEAGDDNHGARHDDHERGDRHQQVDRRRDRTDVGTRIEGIGDDERQDGRIESIPPLSPVADDGWEAPRLRL